MVTREFQEQLLTAITKNIKDNIAIDNKVNQLTISDYIRDILITSAELIEKTYPNLFQHLISLSEMLA